MANATDGVRNLARQQLDRRLARIREVLPAMQPPHGGWIAALRTALGMSQDHLARGLGVTQQTVSQLERREAEGTVTLRALDEAARALGGQLVYAVVPRRSLEDTLEERALALARERTSSVRHTMRLEDQEPDSDPELRARALARELMRSPRKLW